MTSLHDYITVLMPSSPVPSHPSVGVTLDSIARLRSYPELKECEIIIMLDGVRAEQEHRRDDYEEYKRRLSWLRLHNVRLMEFPKHSHQATMTREALETVKTSIVYFVEHDTYAFGEIPWRPFIHIMNADVPVIRLHIFHEILPVHAHLYHERENIGGVPLVRTTQWSQRPHLALTDYYKRIMADFFPPDSITMIEDRMVSPATTLGWDRFRLRVYAPDGDMTRSGTHDGRQGDPKYPMWWDGEWR